MKFLCGIFLLFIFSIANAFSKSGVDIEALDILIITIKKFESFRNKPYQDSDGIWTVGYGFTEKVSRHSYLSRQKAEMKLIILAKQALGHVDIYSPGLNSPASKAAVADLIYNIGINAYVTSNFRFYLNAGECNYAKVELFRWIHARGKILSGLIKRRSYEWVLLDCQWQKNSKSTII